MNAEIIPPDVETDHIRRDCDFFLLMGLRKISHFGPKYPEFLGKIRSVQTFNNFYTSVNSNCTAVEGNNVILRISPFHIGVKGHS